MDPRQKALEQAAIAATDPNVQQQIRRFMATGVPPTDPQAVAAISTALVANGLPPITPAGPSRPAGAPAAAGPTPAAGPAPSAAPGGSDPGREPNRTAATPAPGAGLPSTPPVPAPPAPPPPPAAMPNAGAGPVAGLPTGDLLSPQNQQNAALGKDNYNFAFAKLMDMIGLAPGRQGAFGKTIANTLLPLFQAYMGTDGLANGGVNAFDNRSNAVNQFAQMVGGDKGLMGQLQGVGQGVLGAMGAHHLNDPAEEQRYMTMATALSSAGENPLIRQSIADQMGNAQYAFEKGGFDKLGSPDAPASYIKWLQGQQGADNTDYTDIIRLFGGR